MKANYLQLLTVVLASLLVAAPTKSSSDGEGRDYWNAKRCPYSKSLFVNLTTDDYRKSQVALRVLGANVLAVDEVSGEPVIGAEGHLFLADDAAVLALHPECWPVPSTPEEIVLDEQRQCLQNGGVDCDETVPPVAFLLQQGVRVYGCAACMMDFIMESGCASTLEQGKLEGVELVVPDNLTPFLNLYDRKSKWPLCEVDAAVISF